MTIRTKPPLQLRNGLPIRAGQSTAHAPRLDFDLAEWLNTSHKLVSALESYVESSGHQGAIPMAKPVFSQTDTTGATYALAKQIYRLRRKRDRLIPSRNRATFGEPVWDMLLDLYIAKHECRSISVSSLCLAACVPITTAFRCLCNMVDEGWVVRSPDNVDHRRVIVSLTDDMFNTMTKLLHAW